MGGLSREQVASTIKEQLFKEDLVKDAVVSVEFGGIHFSVLGEVNKPGQYNFENDRETILDAISRAGDLTIYGQRDHVTVIRTEGGERKVYNINMLSGRDITSSPAYYLKQGDIIYVDPNPTRARRAQSTATPSARLPSGLHGLPGHECDDAYQELVNLLSKRKWQQTIA